MAHRVESGLGRRPNNQFIRAATRAAINYSLGRRGLYAGGARTNSYRLGLRRLYAGGAKTNSYETTRDTPLFALSLPPERRKRKSKALQANRLVAAQLRLRRDEPDGRRMGNGSMVDLSGFSVLGGQCGRVGEDAAKSLEFLDAGKVDGDTAASSARLSDIDEGT